MTAENKIGKGLTFFVVALVIITFAGAVIQFAGDTSYNVTTVVSDNTNSSFLDYPYSNNTISPIDKGISSFSATTPNQTWLDFDGGDDYINISYNAIVNFTDNHTVFIDFSVRNRTNPTYTLLADGFDASNKLFFLDYEDDGRLRYNFNNASNSLVAVSSSLDLIKNNESYSFAYTLDNIGNIKTNISYYFDGYYNQTVFYNGKLNYQGIKRYITSGSYRGTQSFMNGTISKLYIFNTSLPSLIIKDIYYGGIKSNYSLNMEEVSFSAENLHVVNSSRIYIASNGNISRTDNGGLTWINLSNVVSPTNIFVTSRGVVIVGTSNSANITVSQLGNDSNFTQVAALFCRNMTGDGYSTLRHWGVTEGNDGSIYLAEYTTWPASGTNCSYIHRSKDNGQSWEIVHNDSNISRHMHMIKADPYTGYIYASEELYYGPDSRLFRSTDNGDTWQLLDADGTQSQYISAVFTEDYRIFGSDKTLYNNIMRTSDDVNYEEVLVINNDLNGFIWDMEIDSKTGYILASSVSATTNKTSSLFISPDNGTSWYHYYDALRSPSSAGINRISDFDELGNSYIYDNVLAKSFKVSFNTTPTSYSPFIRYELNENSGTTPYDSSGNSNNGTISGATWATDGQNRTLVEGVDYTISRANGIMSIINPDMYYSYISSTWNYYTQNTQVDENVGSMMGIVQLVVAMIVVIFLAFGVNYFIKEYY